MNPRLRQCSGKRSFRPRTCTLVSGTRLPMAMCGMPHSSSSISSSSSSSSPASPFVAFVSATSPSTSESSSGLIGLRPRPFFGGKMSLVTARSPRSEFSSSLIAVDAEKLARVSFEIAFKCSFVARLTRSKYYRLMGLSRLRCTDLGAWLLSDRVDKWFRR